MVAKISEPEEKFLSGSLVSSYLSVQSLPDSSTTAIPSSDESVESALLLIFQSAAASTCAVAAP